MSVEKKKILVVSRRYIRKDKLINWVSEVYLELMANAGIVPVIVPVAKGTPALLDVYLESCDGLLMVEGGDLGPQYYNEQYPISELDEYDALKDEIELACFKHAYANKLPILGLCRGMHIINAMLGGSNHLDIHQHNQNKIVHINYQNYDGHRHPVQIIPDTPLSHWYNLPDLSVNSYHHQGIKKLAPSLKPMAIAPDGLVEGVFMPDYAFLVGLQFHPERMLNDYEGNAKVFESFFNAVKQNKK